MNLHVERYEYAGTGSCSTLLLIHGWGMHGGLWRLMAERLAQQFRVYAVDLPGHGYSKAGKGEGKREKGNGGAEILRFPLPSCFFPLDAIVDELSTQFDEPLAVCGWSLGGQIALRWAMCHPQQVQRLILVASTPCFARRADWPWAMDTATLAEFDTALQQDYTLTLRRFLALQVRGGDRERELLVMLRAELFSRGEPDLSALQSGLEILRDCDLHSDLPDISQPALVIAGERDALVPLQASQYLASHMRDARLAMISGAAHAPFLSHPAEFAKHVTDFLNEQEHG